MRSIFGFLVCSVMLVPTKGFAKDHDKNVGADKASAASFDAYADAQLKKLEEVRLLLQRKGYTETELANLLKQELELVKTVDSIARCEVDTQAKGLVLDETAMLAFTKRMTQTMPDFGKDYAKAVKWKDEYFEALEAMTPGQVCALKAACQDSKVKGDACWGIYDFVKIPKSPSVDEDWFLRAFNLLSDEEKQRIRATLLLTRFREREAGITWQRLEKRPDLWTPGKIKRLKEGLVHELLVENNPLGSDSRPLSKEPTELGKDRANRFIRPDEKSTPGAIALAQRQQAAERYRWALQDASTSGHYFKFAIVPNGKDGSPEISLVPTRKLTALQVEQATRFGADVGIGLVRYTGFDLPENSKEALQWWLAFGEIKPDDLGTKEALTEKGLISDGAGPIEYILPGGLTKRGATGLVSILTGKATRAAATRYAVEVAADTVAGQLAHRMATTGSGRTGPGAGKGEKVPANIEAIATAMARRLPTGDLEGVHEGLALNPHAADLVAEVLKTKAAGEPSSRAEARERLRIQDAIRGRSPKDIAAKLNARTPGAARSEVTLADLVLEAEKALEHRQWGADFELVDFLRARGLSPEEIIDWLCFVEPGLKPDLAIARFAGKDCREKARGFVQETQLLSDALTTIFPGAPKPYDVVHSAKQRQEFLGAAAALKSANPAEIAAAARDILALVDKDPDLQKIPAEALQRGINDYSGGRAPEALAAVFAERAARPIAAAALVNQGAQFASLFSNRLFANASKPLTAIGSVSGQAVDDAQKHAQPFVKNVASKLRDARQARESQDRLLETAHRLVAQFPNEAEVPVDISGIPGLRDALRSFNEHGLPFLKDLEERPSLYALNLALHPHRTPDGKLLVLTPDQVTKLEELLKKTERELLAKKTPEPVCPKNAPYAPAVIEVEVAHEGTRVAIEGSDKGEFKTRKRKFYTTEMKPCTTISYNIRITGPVQVDGKWMLRTEEIPVNLESGVTSRISFDENGIHKVSEPRRRP